MIAGQGPRAGTGARRRAQAPLRRRRGRAGSARREGRPARGGRQRVRDWDVQRLAAATGARRASPERSPRAGPTGRASTPAPPGPGELFVGLAGERTDGGRHAPQALSAGAWGVLITDEHAAAAMARARRRGAGAPGPAGCAAGARARVAPRARLPRRPGDRDHGIDRQDLHQGHPGGAAGGPRARGGDPGEPEHPDRPAAGDPRRARQTPRCSCWRWRCAGRARSPS